ncbi:MAG: hypothetical protein K2R93_12215 [Gemmatimonadaceae bacterium]|nr:hypothetical protein [Gemmatimonadaceae bacterium]
MNKPISQREARALKRRVRELEEREAALRRSLGTDYLGTWVCRTVPNDALRDILRTSARLGFVTVARLNYEGDGLNFYAVPTEVRRAP